MLTTGCELRCSRRPRIQSGATDVLPDPGGPKMVVILEAGMVLWTCQSGVGSGASHLFAVGCFRRNRNGGGAPCEDATCVAGLGALLAGCFAQSVFKSSVGGTSGISGGRRPSVLSSENTCKA